MAITLSQPSLVLHSHDVPGYKYQMKYSRTMPRRATPHDVVHWILHAADNDRRMGLDHVVINCHGGPGSLAIGGNGAPSLTVNNLNIFSTLEDTDIGTIWLVSCDVARGPKGKTFCGELARAASCDVVAGASNQKVEFGYYLRLCKWGSIDDFEGSAYRFKPAGGYAFFSADGRRFE